MEVFTIFVVTPEMAADQVKVLEDAAKVSPILFFDDFMQCLIQEYQNPKKHFLPDFVKIPKPMESLLKGDFEPARVIDLRPIKEQVHYDGFPMWHNTSNREFALHGFGLIENNKSKPSTFELFDTSPHMFLGGATGHGKSVTLNDIIMTGALVHPPWKIQFYLNDPKITELKPYALHKNIMPHVNTVAATEDPNYTISMLQYMIDVMTQRNKVFTKAGVKNINAFNDSTGLSMAMLVLVLDECKSMYLKAARQASKIDQLIELFVALARNAGGRCIMASQQVVTEMSKDTMANVNIRACLGCNPTVSTAVVGNVGASVNLGVMGKLTVNLKPGDGNIKDNTYTTSPFMPDTKNSNSRTIYEVFDYVCEIWDLMGGGRLESLSFFDEQEPLTRKQFCDYVNQHAALNRFFLGEPAFIYKNVHPYYHMSFQAETRFDTELAANLLCMSPIPKMRYNMVAIVLANLEAVNKRRKVEVNIYANIKEVSDKISAMGFRLDSADYAMDIEQLFHRTVCSVMYRYILCTADERVFTNQNPEITAPMKECLKLADLGSLSDLMTRRMYACLALLNEAKSLMVLQLDPLRKGNEASFAGYLIGFHSLLRKYNCETKQIKRTTFPLIFNLFIEFDQLKGVEIKTATAKLEQWFDIIRLGPLYQQYTVVFTSVLPSSGMLVAPAFSNLLMYGVPDSSINPFKIRDFYPESIGKMMYVYTNKMLPDNYCFKIKFPEMLELAESDKAEIAEDLSEL